jgi:hypothetical protein
VAGGQPDNAHEWCAGNTDRREVGRGRPAVGDVPVDLERLGEHVAQEPEPRHLGGVAVAVRLDVDDLDVEQVAGLGTVDIYGAGERVQQIEVGLGHDVERGVSPELTVECVAGFEDHLFAWITPEHWRDVRVPSVVAGGRVLAERLRAVDADLVPGLSRH